MNQGNYSVTAQISQEKGASKLENLPAELLNQKRFFPVRITNDGHKVPTIKAWQKLENQMTAYEAIKETGLIGMDICGHGVYPDYFFVDFDHVKDQCGNFLYDDAERWNNYLQIAETFNERSFSKDGTHYLFCPSPNKFPALTGEPNHAIYFDEDKKGKGAPKIELFYCSGRYILLTGDSAPNMEIISGVEADEFCQQLCNQIALDTSHIKDVANACAGAQIDSDVPIEEVKKILAVIPCAKVSYADWFKAAAILHYHYGEAGFEIWRAWSETDPDRYTLEACQRQWDYIARRSALKVSRPATIASLIFFAKQFGYQPKKNADRADDSNEADTIYKEIRKQCVWSKDRNGHPTKIKDWVINYEKIFYNDPNLKGLFGRDDFRQEVVFKRRAPWHSKNAPLKDCWEDSDDSELRLYLAKHYAEMGTNQRTLDFVNRIARENSFHGIRQFLDNLPDWDGEKRLEKILVKFLGAEDTTYTHEVTKHLFLGAIARALNPGCDFQEVVVLQGAQGIGKSRLLRMLGGKHGVNPTGESWHVALRDQLDDSHAVDAMRKGWIIELEEFAATSRTDVNAMKGVLSADDVTRRFAYDRRARTIKAHWIFVGTTNDDSPLRDQTGNRRFLPIKCHNKESQIVEGMTPEYIRLVLAEAYHIYKEMFPTVDDFDADKLRLPVEIQLLAAQKAAGITQDDGLTTEIKGFVDSLILPDYIWHLLSREERRKFFVNGGCLIMKDAVAELNFRRRARGGKREDVQRDVTLISSYINKGGKNENGETTIRIEEISRGKDNAPDKIYHINGTEIRKHICQSEIFNECFGSDNRKRITRISEILSRLDDWTLCERLQKIDPAYPDQRKPYYRSSSNYAKL